jgi:hypothetical protein
MTKSRSGGGWLDCPKIWPGWGGAPEGEGELQCGGGPTEDDLAELSKALRGFDSRFGPGEQWLLDQEGRVKDRVTIPSHLFIMLSNLVDRNVRQLPWTQEKKDWLRAAMVAQEHAAGKTLDEAFAAVAERLTEGETVNGIKTKTTSPAAAGAEMIKKSHQRVMRSLAAEQRPRRTRTRNPPRAKR